MVGEEGAKMDWRGVLGRGGENDRGATGSAASSGVDGRDADIATAGLGTSSRGEAFEGLRRRMEGESRSQGGGTADGATVVGAAGDQGAAAGGVWGRSVADTFRGAF